MCIFVMELKPLRSAMLMRSLMLAFLNFYLPLWLIKKIAICIIGEVLYRKQFWRFRKMRILEHLKRNKRPHLLRLLFRQRFQLQHQ